MRAHCFFFFALSPPLVANVNEPYATNVKISSRTVFVPACQGYFERTRRGETLRAKQRPVCGWLWTLCRRPKRVYVVKGGTQDPPGDARMCWLSRYRGIHHPHSASSSNTSFPVSLLEIFPFPLIRAFVCFLYERQQSLINDRMKKLSAAGGTDLSGPVRGSSLLLLFAPVMCYVVIIVSWELLLFGLPAYVVGCDGVI